MRHYMCRNIASDNSDEALCVVLLLRIKSDEVKMSDECVDDVDQEMYTGNHEIDETKFAASNVNLAIRQGDSEIAEAWFDQAAEYWKQAIALTPGNYIEAQNWLKITRRFE
ncbi:hypothetical protein J1N35_023425 [Gossypium stocksii]|uniref:Photosystem I assembly protein Ycf3 n=1 Tax=Gossypium stocksii TaxID=47602 RepID=A0A9D4A4E3_9ROSI|nr:hypothetical protein J1N35_023425 [Gossypium stocksii]